MAERKPRITAKPTTSKQNRGTQIIRRQINRQSIGIDPRNAKSNIPENIRINGPTAIPSSI